jgi:alkylation response protein AidB-like acyl-CoA dehydrogenase
MDFSQSEEQKDIQTLANQILGDQVTAESLHTFDNRDIPRYDGKLWAQLADSGLLGITIPADKGGMGFGFNELALFIEECGRVLAPVPAVPTLVSAMVLQQFGEHSLLSGVASGEVVLSVAFNEVTHEDVFAPKTTFSGGKLNGTKQCVPYVDMATRLLVVAAEGGKPALFLVDPKDSSIQKTALWSTTYEPQHTLNFKNTPAQKIGGSDAVKYLVDHYTLALCAYQVGAAEKMVQMTAKYTSEREQFGVKIASFQAVGHRMANCYIDAKCLKLVTQQAVSLLAEGNEASTAINVAKAWCGDASHRISYATQHLHGGMGVDRDYPLWRYCLWAKQNELMLGHSTYHLAQLGDAIAAGNYNIDP